MIRKSKNKYCDKPVLLNYVTKVRFKTVRNANKPFIVDINNAYSLAETSFVLVSENATHDYG